MDANLLDLLVCPVSRGPLRYDADRKVLISEQAGLVFPVQDGIPILLAEAARPLDS